MPFKNKEYRKIYVREWYRKNVKGNTQFLKNMSLMSKYKIKLETYNKMFEEQKGKCAICGIHQSELKISLSVDHDHSCCNGEKSCGKCIRGLLCQKCNAAIGMLDESIELLTKVKFYLEKYSIIKNVNICITKS